MPAGPAAPEVRIKSSRSYHLMTEPSKITKCTGIIRTLSGSKAAEFSGAAAGCLDFRMSHCTLYLNHIQMKNSSACSLATRAESNMLEILPKMLLGISQILLLLCSFSVLLCLHYAPKLVRFITIF